MIAVAVVVLMVVVVVMWRSLNTIVLDIEKNRWRVQGREAKR